MWENEEIMSEVLLFSAGLDSFISWLYLNKPSCLHISGHSKYSRTELRTVALLKTLHPEMKLRIIEELEWLREFEELDANIVARNSLFCHIAAYYGDIIFLPCQLGEQEIPDRNPDNLSKLAQTLSIFYGKTKTISIVFPTKTKQDLVSWYLEQGYPKEELWQTYSCESGNEIPCCACKMCFRKAIALDYNNILPNDLQDIWKSDIVKGYILKLKEGGYYEIRAQQTIEILKKRGLWDATR